MMAARTSKREFILHRAIGTDLDHPGATRRPASRDESKDRHVLDPVAQTQWRPSQLIRNNVLVTAIACEPGPAITIEHHTVGNPGIRQVAGVMVFFTNQPFSRNVAWPRLSPSPTPPPRRRPVRAVADSEAKHSATGGGQDGVGGMADRHSPRRLRAFGGSRRLTSPIQGQHQRVQSTGRTAVAAPVKLTVTANFGGFHNVNL